MDPHLVKTEIYLVVALCSEYFTGSLSVYLQTVTYLYYSNNGTDVSLYNFSTGRYTGTQGTTVVSLYL